MKQFQRILKYEFLNVARNRWIFAYAFLLAGMAFTFIQISGDYAKALVTLSSVVTVLIPLTTVLFSAFYWYYSDRFTELLLTQPIPRKTIFFARCAAMIASLSIGFSAGISLPFVIRGAFSLDLLLLSVTGFFLTAIFTTLGLFISLSILDKMKGVGIAFGVWFYCAIVHDGVILLMLLLLREYPLDAPAATLGTLNPIGLSRVILMMQYNSAMLLGHTGALTRNLLTSNAGLVIALFLSSAWLIAPPLLAIRRFYRRDF